MRKFIHLRGGNASGKAFTIRSFIESGNFDVFHVSIDGIDYPYTYDKKNNWVVTGRYDTSNYGGIDREIRNKNILKVYLKRLMDDIRPDVIVFEAIMYGITFKFSYELNLICSNSGYEYRGVCLFPDFDAVKKNAYERNSGKPINEKRLYDKWIKSFVSSLMLSDAGIRCDIVDPSEYSFYSIKKIVEDRIRW